MTERVCSIEGCNRTGKLTRGWCGRHYYYWQKHGDPLALDQEYFRGTGLERFEHFTDKNGPLPGTNTLAAGLGPCWIWTGTLSGGVSGGYARMGADGRSVWAHRFSYEHYVGELVPGLQIDHLCRVRCCVNPDHLEQVTPRDNVIRGDSFAAKEAKKTHCKRGHPFDEKNTRITPKGHRDCRACIALRAIAKGIQQAAEGKTTTHTIADYDAMLAELEAS